jgi:UDP-N-acetylmuramyl tripeptide synthase
MKSMAVTAGKCASALSRALDLGEGLTFPGLVAERLHPTIIEDLAPTLRDGSILVTGTNGKTTSTKLLAEMLARSGRRVLTNSSGSNLRRGIASAFVGATGLSGTRLRADVAALEVDEASMPAVAAATHPRLIVINNLLRDQLDRHGDVDALAERLIASIAAAPEAAVLLNADDPLLVGIGDAFPERVRYFGIDDDRVGSDDRRGAAKAADCPACGSSVSYDQRHYAHLGDWHCLECGRARPELDFAASKVRLLTGASVFGLRAGDDEGSLHLAVPGLHNVYNALGSGAAALLSGASRADVAATTLRFTPPFGRSESFVFEGHRVVLLLAKNPSGADQALAPILAGDSSPVVAFMLNDNPADGADVSWIWDVGLDSLDLSRCTFVTSGTRAEDAALRFKYAGARLDRVHVASGTADAVRRLVSLTPAGATAHIVATYTAMLDVRRLLVGGDGPLSRLGRSFGLA